MKTAEEIIHEVIGIKPGAGPFTPMDYSECKKCIEYAASQRTVSHEQEWISVYDKKPEDKGHYLAVELDKSETPFVAFYNTVEWRSNDGAWVHPTHWMRLPNNPINRNIG